MTGSVTLPLRLVSEANERGHWSKKAKRVKSHRMAMIAVPAWMLRLPCTITLVRIAPRKLDDDNMVSAGKGARDGLADRLGVKDNDPRVTWRYAQERGKPKEYACRIEVLDRPD